MPSLEHFLFLSSRIPYFLGVSPTSFITVSQYPSLVFLLLPNFVMWNITELSPQFSFLLYTFCLVISYSLMALKAIYVNNFQTFITNRLSPKFQTWIANCLFNIFTWMSKRHLNLNKIPPQLCSSIVSPFQMTQLYTSVVPPWPYSLVSIQELTHGSKGENINSINWSKYMRKVPIWQS